MATLCEYPAGLNGSAVQFERCCGLGDMHHHAAAEHRPLPCPAVKAAATRQSCASTVAASEDEEEQQQQPAPSRRVTRSRAGKSDGK